VVQLLEDFNLADGRDREALSLVVHADLLERHDFLRLHLLRHEYLPVGALPDLLELLEAVDAAGPERRRLVEVELPRRRRRHGLRPLRCAWRCARVWLGTTRGLGLGAAA